MGYYIIDFAILENAHFFNDAIWILNTLKDAELAA